MTESHGTREAVGHVGSTVSKPREKQIGAPLTFSLLCNPGPRPRITQLSQPGNSFLHRQLSPRWFHTLSNRQQILHNHYTSSQPRSRTAFWRLQSNLRTKNFLITEGPVSISPSKQRNPRLWSVTSYCPVVWLRSSTCLLRCPYWPASPCLLHWDAQDSHENNQFVKVLIFFYSQCCRGLVTGWLVRCACSSSSHKQC